MTIGGNPLFNYNFTFIELGFFIPLILLGVSILSISHLYTNKI